MNGRVNRQRNTAQGEIVGNAEVTVLLALVSERPVAAKTANGLWHVSSEVHVQPLAGVDTGTS